jgi:hypothetical protein
VTKIKKKYENSCALLHTLGYPLLCVKEEEEEEEEEARQREPAEGSGSLSVHRSVRRAAKQRSIERTLRGEERRKKKKRDLNYFPKGFKSEILSETSLFSISRGKRLAL